MKCYSCNKDFKDDTEGSAKVTVSLINSDEGTKQRWTAAMDLCPTCYTETELDDFIMQFETVETLKVAGHE